MAPRTKEDFQNLEHEIKILKKQVVDMPKLLEHIEQLKQSNNDLKEANNQLRTDNKGLSKSGAVIHSKVSTFDMKTDLGEGKPKLLFRTNHTPNDWDDHYRYDTKGSGDPVDYIIKYRDGKFRDSILG